MKKTTLFAMLGLAAALTFAIPSQAHAGVVVGVGIGPVVPAPVYGRVYVGPTPYYYPGYYPAPYAYGPGYVAGYRPYRYYGYYGRDYRWDRDRRMHRDFRYDHDPYYRDHYRR